MTHKTAEERATSPLARRVIALLKEPANAAGLMPADIALALSAASGAVRMACVRLTERGVLARVTEGYRYHDGGPTP